MLMKHITRANDWWKHLFVQSYEIAIFWVYVLDKQWSVSYFVATIIDKAGSFYPWEFELICD